MQKPKNGSKHGKNNYPPPHFHTFAGNQDEKEKATPQNNFLSNDAIKEICEKFVTQKLLGNNPNLSDDYMNWLFFIPLLSSYFTIFLSVFLDYSLQALHLHIHSVPSPFSFIVPILSFSLLYLF